MDPDQERAGLAWQMGVWNRIADIYLREIDHHACPTQWYLADQGVGTVLGFCPHHEWCARVGHHACEGAQLEAGVGQQAQPDRR